MVENDRQSHPVPPEHRRGRDAEALSPFPVWYATLASEKHPERNEDQVLIDTNKRVMAVFDGMGGEASGEVASKCAQEVFHARLVEPRSVDTVIENISTSFSIACEALATEESNHPHRKGMGTTIALAQVVAEEGTQQVVYVSAGDSRLYVVREQDLVQLTVDDNLVELERKSGELSEVRAQEINDMLDTVQTKDEAAAVAPFFAQRNVVINGIVASGAEEPQIGIYEIQPGDQLLLATTDGVHDNLTRAEIEEITHTVPARDLAQELTQKARDISEKGNPRSKPDDMTAVVMKL